jgi:hypothetical protein
MTLNNRSLPLLTLLLTPLALPTPALIAVKTPVSQMYAGSPTVIVGKITTFTPTTGILEATATTLKGDGVGDTIKLKLDNLPTLTQSIKPNQPLLLFLARRPANNALHLADTWLTPEPVPASKSNFVVRTEKDLRQSFPGTTTALAAVVADLKAGKNTMLDAAHPGLFKGGTKDLGQFHDPHVSLFAMSLPRMKQTTIFSKSEAEFREYALRPDGIAITIPNRPFSPDFMRFTPAGVLTVAVAVVDGKGPRVVCLRKDGQVLNSEGAPMKQLWSDPTPATAAAIGNFGEDDKPHAIVIKNNQILRYPLDASSPPADFLRLTGERLTTYARDNPDYLANATAHPLDANGDGRTDCLLTTATGPLLLINRGHGAFFIENDLAKTLPQLTPNQTLWTAADIDNDQRDDLILIQDNKVTAILNPKQEEKK